MKKIIFILTIFHFSLIIANAQWIVISDTTMNNAIEVFADNGYYLYAAVPGIGIYKTSNYGVTWNLSSIDINARFANCLAAKDNMVFLANDTGLCKSSNYGNNWFIIDTTIELGVASVIIVENYLFIGTDKGIYRSTNWGNNWLLVNSEINWKYQYIKYFAFSNNYLYVAIDNDGRLEVYKSVNFGDNWSLISQDIPWNNIPYSLYACENLLLCGTASGVFKSTNAGVNWGLIQGISGNIGLFGFASVGMKNIFISAWDFGLYVSNDSGHIFNLRNEGLFNLRCTALYKFGNYLFLGTNPPYLPCEIYRRPLNEVIAVKNISSEIPKYFKLYQNYPNPFNSVSSIRYQVSRLENGNMKMENGIISIKVYDIIGKKVATLVSEKQNPGIYEVQFDGSNFSSGIYFYSLFIDEKRIDTKKLLLIK